MRYALLLAAAGTAVDGHTLFTNFYVDGVDQGDGTCVRMSNHPNNATFPQPDISAPSMACGFNGETGVARTCATNAGSSISFEFRDHPDGSQPGSIDPSHKGPCAVYMKKVDDATKNGTAAGSGWFKIFSQDYDNATSQWCTEKLIANNGHLTVNIPSDLAGGNYLLRPELLALHQADKTPPDPQFYLGCAQIFLNSTGTSVPQDTTSIPGYVNISMPAMTFNIWKKPMSLPYPPFGPPVYQSSKGNANKRSDILNNRDQAKNGATEQTTGLKPDGCILTVSNWCGMELAPYNTQDGCWNASKACYTQDSLCWSSAGPTGGQKCKIWEQKCKGIQQGCGSGNYQGPPDAGKLLDPPLKQVQLPAPYTNTGATSDAAASAAKSNSTTANTPSETLPQAPPESNGTSNSGSVLPTQSTLPSITEATIKMDGSINVCGAANNSAACASGMCCSSHGYCGSSEEYCGEGCQSAFGTCRTASSAKLRPRRLPARRLVF